MTKIELVICAGAFAFILLSFALSLWLANAHIFQRAGAALLVAGAGLIFWQLRVERTLEKRLEQATSLKAVVGRLPGEKLAAEIAHARGDKLVAEVSFERTRLVSYLAGFTAVGEGIHGFGDLLIEAIQCSFR